VHPGPGLEDEQPPGGSIVVVTEMDRQVAHLIGDVDADLIASAGGPQLFDRLAIAAVDVGELAYIDSSGLSLLVRWARSRGQLGERAPIRGMTPRFAKVLMVSGLTEVFDVES
jgi:anti-sigma B factor antagonist